MGTKKLKHFLIKVLAISGNSKDFSIFKKNLKNYPLGGGGLPQTFVHLKSYFLGELEPHAKFHNPRTTLSGRKVYVGGGGPNL